MKTEDGAIIYKCLNGDREAFAILIDKYKAGIYAYVCAKLNNMDDAEDVTQEVFIRAYRDLQKLRRWDSFAYWIYSIATCQCRNWIRSKSRRPDHDFIEDQEPIKLEKMLAEPAIESYQSKQIDESLHEALNSLPEIYREVLMLYYMNGMNSEQIANMLAVSPESIRQRLSRARAMLKEEVIAMMDRTLPQYKLQASFTFRIVEAIKRIKIHPSSQSRNLPLGLSLATGLLIAVLGINPAFVTLRDFGTPIFAPLPSETKVLKSGEIPVDTIKISDIPMLSSKMGKGKGGEVKLDMENAFFMAPQGVGEWVKKADMPTARSSFCTTVVNGKIYAIGGESWAGMLSSVEEYDPIKDKWEIKSSMPKAKMVHCVISVGGKIYAFGGQDNNFNWLLSVYEYDPVLDKWTAKNDALRPYTPSGVCALNSKIYAFGALDENRGDLGKVCEYDPVADLWTEKSKMPTSRLWMDACPVNGKIYVIGGIGDGNVPISTVEEYDPVRDTWEKKSDMPTARSHMKACAVGAKIYSIGGWSNGQHLKTVDIYDTLTNTWTKGIDMQTLRWWFSASVVDEKIYAIGGYNGANILSDVEEFDTGFIPKSIEPSEKLPKTWGNLKSK